MKQCTINNMLMISKELLSNIYNAKVVACMIIIRRVCIGGNSSGCVYFVYY